MHSQSHLQNVVHVQLPTQVVEKPAAIHEEIRRERVEEIQPVVNIEKLQTQVVQKTQPLFDKEVRAVGIQEKVLPTQVLPDVIIPNRGVPLQGDVSTVQYRDQKEMVVEKPAIFNEVDKTRIIEEIQPVIYKETVIPTLIRETKPVYQTIVEGTTYAHETLPPMQLHGSRFETFQTLPVQQVIQQPIVQQPIVQQPIQREVKPHLHHEAKKPHHLVEETTTTRTTTVIPNREVRGI
jgi:hypothetical protein